ncbi:hypothetical protein ACTWQB_01945 [Piscibacillus sp. B03]|uniref:hypothetical protein n=1 Tax=Piscibacillus sp. B03 TaxID=3457430 RepID=UPI003FCCA115
MASENLYKRINSFEEVVQANYNNKYQYIRFSKNIDAIVKLEQQFIDYHFNKKLTLNDLLTKEPEEDAEDVPAYLLINKVASGFYKQNKHNSRVTFEDFLSACYIKAWKVISNYKYQLNYWLYPLLQNHLKNACIDFLRLEGLTSDRNTKPIHMATSLSDSLYEVPDASNMEQNILLKELLHETVKTLTQEEYEAFMVYVEADNIEKVTLDDIRKKLNLKHRTQAKRLIDKVREKFKNVYKYV